ncbi:TPA: restriction endonuclease subunit S [Enterobacter kobei]|nr:restriction endonuclease subunit S [Enterobacter kobei]
MSELSYLEKLLDGAEVEWRALSEVATYVRGLIYSKSNESADGQGLRVLRANNITLSGNHLNFNDIKVVRFDTKVKDSQKLYKYDILISAASGSREHVGKVAYIESDIDYYFGGFMGVVRCNGKLNARYLFHVLTSGMFQKYLDEMLNSSTINNLSSAVMGGFNIPIPCPNNPEKSLAIQSAIVRILDKFTALTAELTSELTARKKQYNYYRDQLLSFEEGDVEWKTLGEISRKISSGGTPKTGVTEYYDGTIPWLRTQEVDFREIWDTEIKITEEGLKTSSAKWIPKDCIIIAMYGATVGKIGINKIPMTTNQACANIQLDEEIVHYRYVFHFLCSQYAYIKSLGTGSQTNINAQIVKNIKIPVPFAENPEKSLNEQLRIVNILDKFDTLTSSITEGLPREIELRQKQYEYYRDLLFSFPRPETASN